MKYTIAIDGEFIELFRLLKLARLVETWWQAKEAIRNHQVRLWDDIVQELRKKIRPGDNVFYGDDEIEVTAK